MQSEVKPVTVNTQLPAPKDIDLIVVRIPQCQIYRPETNHVRRNPSPVDRSRFKLVRRCQNITLQRLVVLHGGCAVIRNVRRPPLSPCLIAERVPEDRIADALSPFQIIDHTGIVLTPLKVVP